MYALKDGIRRKVCLDKQNLHTHTLYVDGKNSPEEMILEAISREFDSLGFSEHTFLRYSTYPNQLTPEKAELYRNEIRFLKQKYRGKLDVFLGLEYDFYSDVDTEGYDYLIGSVHYLECESGVKTFDKNLEHTREFIKDNFNGKAFDFAKKYYETVARLPEKHAFDIICHFDLVTKNNETGRFIDTSKKEYLDLGYETIHALRGKIPFFEVNTGAIARAYRTAPYPQLEFLKEFKRLGFGAVISSDCHDKTFLDCHFDGAREFLRAAGFESRWILTDLGFREVRL